MAYIIGLVTQEEKEELERRGWELSPAEEVTKEISSVGKDDKIDENLELLGVYVDNNMFSVMDGPDWEKG